MIKRNLYFKDGVLFADGYERVVHGGRGDYVELSKEQIQVDLVPKFSNTIPSEITGQEEFFYYWLRPKERDEKVYWQCKQVHYADYKIGYYYIDPALLQKFDSIELF